jgi:DNA-directed RNA polymerase specialized sigma24 family protein
MAADELRRRSRLGTFPAEIAVPDEVDAVRERIALMRALGTLAPEHQLVVHLRLVEELPFADVALAMNRSVGACQMLLLRAARALRTALEAEGVREGV